LAEVQGIDRRHAGGHNVYVWHVTKSSYLTQKLEQVKPVRRRTEMGELRLESFDVGVNLLLSPVRYVLNLSLGAHRREVRKRGLG